VTASIDLALAMVEKDLGAEIARLVARKMVVYHRRSGGQSQFSTLPELEPKSDRIQRVLDYANRNLKNPLQVDRSRRGAGRDVARRRLQRRRPRKSRKAR
jgi:transcriptional regulator GlxA family with amidase domain